jgi:quercetin dioxygenase-like cupin family protein
MRSSPRLLRFGLASLFLAPTAILMTASSPIGATPSSGITAEVLAQGQTADQVHVEQTGETDMVFERITIQPGGSTGWHYHLGPILAVVDSGTLTHYDDHCGVET